MNDPHKLIEICKALVIRKDLQPGQPTPSSTHCNQFVDEALHEWLGECVIGKEFHGLMANAIVDKLAEDEAWMQFEVEELARYGGLLEAGHPAIAGEKESGHGHVNLVVVGMPVDSGHWGCQVPLAANVGKDNWVGKGLNFAFVHKPKIWILK